MTTARFRTVRFFERGYWMGDFLVQAKHERVAAFYRHFGFQPFEHSPSVLHITRKTASAVCSNC